MKNQILFLLAVLVFSFAAGTHFNSSIRPASVEKENGLFVFWDCKPSDNYEVIGTVGESAFSLKPGTYARTRSTFIKKALHEYPQAEGIIYNPDITGHYEVLVIKFK